MKAYLINEGSCFWLDSSSTNREKLVEIEVPIEAEILEIKDFHLFGDTSLDKNTSVTFKIKNDDRIFHTNYGWIFIEHTDDALERYKDYKHSLDAYIEAEKAKENLRKLLPTLDKRVNN